MPGHAHYDPHGNNVFVGVKRVGHPTIGNGLIRLRRGKVAEVVIEARPRQIGHGEGAGLQCSWVLYKFERVCFIPQARLSAE